MKNSRLNIDPKFFERHYQISPVLMKNSHQYDQSYDAINQYIFDAPNLIPSLSVYLNGERKKEHEYFEPYLESQTPSRRINKLHLENFLHEGASLVFNRMNSHSLPMAEICSDFQLYIREKIHAHGYFALKDKESLGFHWDTYDVFVVQLIGRKRWIVKRPTLELPLPKQTTQETDIPPDDVYLDDVAEAGDILYIPNGWWHTALPMYEPTFHLAIGVHTKKTLHFLDWVVKVKMPSVLTCRKDAQSFKNDKEAASKDILSCLNKFLLDKSVFDEFVNSYDAPSQQKNLIDLRDAGSKILDEDHVFLSFAHLWNSIEMKAGNISLNGIHFSLENQDIPLFEYLRNNELVQVKHIVSLFGEPARHTLQLLVKIGLLLKQKS